MAPLVAFLPYSDRIYFDCSRPSICPHSFHQPFHRPFSYLLIIITYIHNRLHSSICFSSCSSSFPASLLTLTPSSSLLLIRILTDSPSPDPDSFLLLLSPSSVCVLSPHFHLSLVRTRTRVCGTSDSCRRAAMRLDRVLLLLLLACCLQQLPRKAQGRQADTRLSAFGDLRTFGPEVLKRPPLREGPGGGSTLNNTTPSPSCRSSCSWCVRAKHDT